jgi:hypothetical protein
LEVAGGDTPETFTLDFSDDEIKLLDTARGIMDWKTALLVWARFYNQYFKMQEVKKK